MDPKREKTLGALCAAACFAFWGVLPLYFHMLHHIGPMEMLAERILWTVVTLVVVKAAMGRLSDLKTVFANRAQTLNFAFSAACIGSNWLIFVYAVSIERVLQTSLGYFICPLISVLLGVLFLGEKLSPARGVAVGLATLAVLMLMVYLGQPPVIALGLALTFALYGLSRKKIVVDPLTGLYGDVIFLLPLAIGYLGWLTINGENTFFTGTNFDRVALYLLAPFTIGPLAMFAVGVRRLDLATVGFIQYLAPIISFTMAVFVLGESFGGVQLACFALIWVALVIYTIDAFRHTTRLKLEPATAPVVPEEPRVLVQERCPRPAA